MELRQYVLIIIAIISALFYGASCTSCYSYNAYYLSETFHSNCTYGCCGYTVQRSCCKAPSTGWSTGILIGIVASAVVFCMLVITISCVCRYQANKRRETTVVSIRGQNMGNTGVQVIHNNMAMGLISAQNGLINSPQQYMRMNNQQRAMQFTPSGALAYDAMRGPAQPAGPGYMVTSAYPQGLPPPPQYEHTCTDTRLPVPSFATANRNCNTPMPAPPTETLQVEDIEKDKQ